MSAREEFAETLATLFLIQIREYDDHGYDYYVDESMWTDHIKAFDSIAKVPHHHRRIVLKRLEALNNGGVLWQTIKTVWEAGVWVSGEHDPRASDPEFLTYLRLREKFGEALDQPV